MTRRHRSATKRQRLQFSGQHLVMTAESRGVLTLGVL